MGLSHGIQYVDSLQQPLSLAESERLTRRQSLVDSITSTISSAINDALSQVGASVTGAVSDATDPIDVSSLTDTIVNGVLGSISSAVGGILV